MNKYLPYEKIIARKLQEIPVTDANMMLWMNISKNIRRGKGQYFLTKKEVIKFGSIGILLISLLIVILIALTRKKANTRVKRTQEIENAGSEKTYNPDKSSDTGLLYKAKKKVLSALLSGEKDEQSDSSQVLRPILATPEKQQELKESAGFKKEIDPIPALFPPQEKKSKGVVGISDSDYKLMIKKDSL